MTPSRLVPLNREFKPETIPPVGGMLYSVELFSKIKRADIAINSLVTPTGQFSNHLLERFKKIYELKAVIPVIMLQPAILPRKLRVA